MNYILSRFRFWRDSPKVRASSFTRFLHHTQRRTTVGRTPLDERSVRRIDLYLTKHNTHNRQTSMPPVGFEPTISAGERPHTYALDRAAIGTGDELHYKVYFWMRNVNKLINQYILLWITHPLPLLVSYHKLKYKFAWIIQGYRKRWTGFETAIT